MLDRLKVFRHEILPCSPSDLEARIQDITEQTQVLDECKDLIRSSRKFNRSQKSYLLHQLDAISKNLYAEMNTTVDALNDEGDRLN